MGIGLLLLGGIYALGKLSERQSRFGVLSSSVAVAALYCARPSPSFCMDFIATLVIYTIIYQVTGWAMNAVLVGLPIGAIVCVFSLISTARSVYRPKPAAVVAAELTRENSPELRSLISRIARTVHAREPDHVIAGLQPTFYASLCDHELFGSERILRGETVYVSLPYLRMMNSAELSAILAHELGHFKSGDVQYFHAICSPVRQGCRIPSIDCASWRAGPVSLRTPPFPFSSFFSNGSMSPILRYLANGSLTQTASEQGLPAPMRQQPLS